MPSLNYTISGTLILHSTIFRWRQRECAGFSENLPTCHDLYSTLSEWLVPTLWSLVLISIAVTSAVYVPSSWITWGSLVDPPLHWVLCRWLAGVNQRITPPLFLMVYILLTFSVLSHCYRTIIPQVTGEVKCLFSFICSVYSFGLYWLHLLL